MCSHPLKTRLFTDAAVSTGAALTVCDLCQGWQCPCICLQPLGAESLAAAVVSALNWPTAHEACASSGLAFRPKLGLAAESTAVQCS
jgi:hypothetical protein